MSEWRTVGQVGAAEKAAHCPSRALGGSPRDPGLDRGRRATDTERV
jgi:hypothetical protein